MFGLWSQETFDQTFSKSNSMNGARRLWLVRVKCGNRVGFPCVLKPSIFIVQPC